MMKISGLCTSATSVLLSALRSCFLGTRLGRQTLSPQALVSLRPLTPEAELISVREGPACQRNIVRKSPFKTIKVDSGLDDWRGYTDEWIDHFTSEGYRKGVVWTRSPAAQVVLVIQYCQIIVLISGIASPIQKPAPPLRLLPASMRQFQSELGCSGDWQAECPPRTPTTQGMTSGRKRRRQAPRV
jgi:hypothetical protein